jgi:hypothetical protein
LFKLGKNKFIAHGRPGSHAQNPAGGGSKKMVSELQLRLITIQD